MSALPILALSFQCFVSHMEWASSIEIIKPFSLQQLSRPAKTKNLSKLLKAVWNDGDPDPRYFAISWVESRLRIYPELGNNGRACGTFQIHAHQSAPTFRVGWNKWYKLDKAVTKPIVAQECIDLQEINYSVKVMSRFLKLYDKMDLNICHHQCGIYGKCKPWYKDRADFWHSYFALAKLVCDDEETDTEIMAFVKTGNPAPAVPAEMIQGYLDGAAGRPASSESDIYKAGYTLAAEVKAGTKPAPVWAPPA